MFSPHQAVALAVLCMAWTGAAWATPAPVSASPMPVPLPLPREGVAALAIEPPAPPQVPDDGPILAIGPETTIDHPITLFDGPLVVPGSTGTAAFQVRNAGPSDAVLTASFTDVDATGGSAGFLQSLTLNGHPVADLRDTPSTMFECTAIARGATTPVQVAYAFPQEATAGRSSAEGPATISFSVTVTLTGNDTECARLEGQGWAPSSIRKTGADPLPWAVLALLALTAGVALRTAGRSRKP